MEEIWKDIPGYEGSYQASTYGRIKSLDRVVKGWLGASRNLKGQIMKCSDMHKYLGIGLCKDGVHKVHTAHRLIAQAFLPNPEGKRTINHIDADKHNNRLSNLEWATYKENINHAYKLGIMNIDKLTGENNYGAKLTNQQVKNIKEEIRNGARGVDLANKYKVSDRIICAVKTGRTWKHIA